MKNYKELFLSSNKEAIEQGKRKQKIARIIAKFIVLILSVCIVSFVITYLEYHSLPKSLLYVYSAVIKSLGSFFFFTLIGSIVIYLLVRFTIIDGISRKDYFENLAKEFAVNNIGKDLIDVINKKFSSEITNKKSFNEAIREWWWIEDDLEFVSSRSIEISDNTFKFDFENKEYILKKWKYSKKGFRAKFNIIHPDGKFEKGVKFELSTE